MLNGPEARHGTVINAVRRAGHALRHSCLHELVVKCPVGILEPSVAMEQGVRVWIGFHGIFKGFVNQWIVIAFAEHIGHDAPVAKVEDGAQIEFMYHYTVKSLCILSINHHTDCGCVTGTFCSIKKNHKKGFFMAFL